MGTFKQSNGERITKANIDANIRVAKSLFVDRCCYHEQLYCWDCGKNWWKMSVSHIVSVNKCQNDGKVEQAWNLENFEWLCIPCHQKWENEKKLNKRREMYIEFYNKIKK